MSLAIDHLAGRHLDPPSLVQYSTSRLLSFRDADSVLQHGNHIHGAGMAGQRPSRLNGISLTVDGRRSTRSGRLQYGSVSYDLELAISRWPAPLRQKLVGRGCKRAGVDRTDKTLKNVKSGWVKD